ncbi:hypothetical protein GCM10010358_10850 [Streptomyces minutiscleroticus]|uniref:Uncharacterized protein n=1 Tax=Streptomyces minutiscleroticus TaxID=68238 RepID=A0A918KDM2_9ACTN|nr:hypothetical protein [Streptomyces minutiscleroticus]GGX58615.1 hypothetical protein GCM10010358_10850 [Streptomyces minutiscleroticus]
MTSDKQFKKAVRALAAREGISYTAARRRLTAATEPPPAAPGPDAARYGWDGTAVAALRDVVGRRGTVPVRVVEADGAPSSAFRQGRRGVAEPTADGYVIHELPHRRMPAPDPAARVPVPYRAADGRVAVAALWPLVWRPRHDALWRWVHNGWAVERPGDLPDGPHPVRPSPHLPYEVRVFHVPYGILGGEHRGAVPNWLTWGWCSDPERARELADAMVAHRLSGPVDPHDVEAGYVRAQVWHHGTAGPGAAPGRIHQADAAPGRPVVPRPPLGSRPPGRPGPARPAPEPAWTHGGRPPALELKTWSAADGWVSHTWFPGGRDSAAVTAVLLRVGAGGRWAFAETWEPRRPDAWAGDWTQAGRAPVDHHPTMGTAERAARIEALRRAETDRLAAALAGRSQGALTAGQAAARLRAGGAEYRDFLRTGAACVAEALHRARRTARGAERLRLREALDALEERHEVADWVVDLTLDHLAADPDAHLTPEARAHRRRALQEYLAPDADAGRVPGPGAG